MSDTRTTTVALKALPVRAVKATVTEGPDKGKTATAAADRLTIGTADDNDLVLTDATVSRYHLELKCLGGEVHLVDHESTNGTFEGQVRISRGVVPPGASVRVGKTHLRIDDAGAREVELVEGDGFGVLRGQSAPMRRVMATVARAAQAQAAVLVVGESGTGKELIATAIHESSARAKGPLVVVDCGSLAPSLVASELFGHEKGAFTGADDQHAGAFERADGGTLFLDEIGELPPALQPTLLGVLERKRFRRVGGRAELTTDVRVVSATNRDLKAEVNAGRFRLDLYYRLAVLRIEVPPLRERPEDVPLLVEHFLKQLGGTPQKVPADVLQRLKAHAWPGNVRELRNYVEATLALGEPAQLDGVVDGGNPDGPGALEFTAFEAMPFKQARAAMLDAFEARYVRRLLDRSDGNVAQAARLADLDRSYLHELIRRHKLKG